MQQIISNLAHVSREPENVLYPLTQHLSPIEVIQSVPDWFFNVQARYLVAAFTPRVGTDLLLTDERWILANLHNAIARLEWMAPTEKLDEFSRIFIAETGLSQPSVMISRNHAPENVTDRWKEVRQWLSENSHLYAIDSLLYKESWSRFDEHCNRFWRIASRGDRRFADRAREVACAHQSDCGVIKLGLGWTFREHCEQSGLVYQVGPTTDSLLHLSNVSGRYLTFDIVFVGGIAADEIAFIDADRGGCLPAKVMCSGKRTRVYVELPRDRQEFSVLVRSPRAIPLCVYNNDWTHSRAPVPFAATSWSIIKEIATCM